MSSDGEMQERELWNRIGTTEGAARAEVLDVLRHIAYKKNNYAARLSLIETSIDIYFTMKSEFHTKELIHLYEGKAFCHNNLGQHEEAAEAFETLAGYFCIDEDREGFIKAKRSAGREWYSAGKYEKSLEAHTAATLELDPDATNYTMGIDNLNMGMALQKLAFHEEAIKYFLIARPLFKSDKNPEFVNWCDCYIIDSYIALGNGIEALFHAQRYLNYAEVTQDLDMQSTAAFNLGQAHRLLKDYSAAELLLRRSLDLLASFEDKQWSEMIDTTHELAAVLFAQGRDLEANRYLDRIATIEETMVGD